MNKKFALAATSLLIAAMSKGIDYSVVSSSAELDWSSTSTPNQVQLSKFNPSLGVLKAVTFIWTHTGYAEFGIESTSAGTQPVFGITQGQFAPIVTDTNGGFVSILGRQSLQRTAFFADGPYDGITDYAGTSGSRIRINFTGSGSFSNAQLVNKPQFTGVGLLTLNGNGGSTQLSVSDPVGGPGSGRGLGWAAQTHITLQYTYEAVPEPITLGAFGMSLICLYRSRKTKKPTC